MELINKTIDMIKLQDAENGQYYFTLIARNGEVVMTSKMYDRKDVARDSADAIGDMDFEVGDFCVRKKPGPKPGNGLDRRQEEPDAEDKAIINLKQ